jgi:hypothetical protein
MKKNTLLRIGIIVFVVIASITLIYNYYLISPTTRYAGVDKFGIKEIFPTKTGGEEWFMNMDDPGSDPKREEKDHQPSSCNKMMMVVGKYEVLRCVMAC